MQKIIMEQVESTNLREIGYDALARTLYVRMKNTQAMYVYKKVPIGVFTGLQKAESKGKYFLTEVKGKFEYEKL